MTSPFKDQILDVVLVSEGDPDDNGVPVVSETRVSWGPASVQQQQTTELKDDQTIVLTSYRVSGPPLSTIDGLSRVEWDGRVFSLIGKPDTRTGPLRINRTRFYMEEVTG